MNNIEILEDFIKEKIEPDKLEKYKGGYKMGFFYTKDLQKAIENLIKENKELKEYQYKVNEIMNFDEENLDVTRVSNNYIGLKNCVTQFRKQVEKLEQENKELKNKCNELNFKYTAQWVDDNFIPKSKIKAKIEELDEEYKEAYNKGFKTDMINRLREIKLMQSLLEKE